MYDSPLKTFGFLDFKIDFISFQEIWTTGILVCPGVEAHIGTIWTTQQLISPPTHVHLLLIAHCIRRLLCGNQNQVAEAMAPVKMQQKKQYYVLHQVCEQIVKLVASYPTKEEAFTEALNRQIEALQGMKETLVTQMRQEYANRSCEWKLKMLQSAMRKFIADVGLEGWTDTFLVMSTQVNSITPASHIRIRWKPQCDDITPHKGSRPHDEFGSRPSTMAKYMYWTLPFGPVEWHLNSQTSIGPNQFRYHITNVLALMELTFMTSESNFLQSNSYISSWLSTSLWCQPSKLKHSRIAYWDPVQTSMWW